MFLGEVVSHVVSTIKWDGLKGLKLLLVKPYELQHLESATKLAMDSEGSDGVVVVDTLDAGVGDKVIVAFGHAARVAVSPEIASNQEPPLPIDAAVVAVVDNFEVFRTK